MATWCMPCVSRKFCLCETTTLTPVPAGRTAFRIFRVRRSKIALATAFTTFPTVLPFKGQGFTGQATLQPTSAARTFWYREISTTSAVELENSPITYAQFAIKLKVTEATRTRPTSINLFLGFAPLSPRLGNCTVGPITSSSGVPFRHVAAAHPESSMMNLIQTANPAVHRTCAKSRATPVTSTLAFSAN